MGTLMKESARNSSSVRSKSRLRNSGCPCILSTITGLPVANTCPVTPTPGVYSPWLARGGASARQSRSSPVSGSKSTRCARRKACREASMRSRSVRAGRKGRRGPSVPAISRSDSSQGAISLSAAADAGTKSCGSGMFPPTSARRCGLCNTRPGQSRSEAGS